MEVKHREKNMTYDTKSISYKDMIQNGFYRRDQDDGILPTLLHSKAVMVHKRCWNTSFSCQKETAMSVMASFWTELEWKWS